jgi:chromosome segregation protein
MDAVLFSLGELSTRRMRAENASKLIFHGSETAGQEKAKMAKVVIQFDNSDGVMPIDTTTVTVSREVFRNGQSVYRLNGRRMSLTQVSETSHGKPSSEHESKHHSTGTITNYNRLQP